MGCRGANVKRHGILQANLPASSGAEPQTAPLPGMLFTLFGTTHGHGTGAGHFLDAEAVQQAEDGVQLVVVAGGLDGQRFRIHVHHAHAEQTLSLIHISEPTRRS